MARAAQAGTSAAKGPCRRQQQPPACPPRLGQRCTRPARMQARASSSRRQKQARWRWGQRRTAQVARVSRTKMRPGRAPLRSCPGAFTQPARARSLTARCVASGYPKTLSCGDGIPNLKMDCHWQNLVPTLLDVLNCCCAARWLQQTLPPAGWSLSWQPRRPRVRSPPGSRAQEMLLPPADLRSLAQLAVGYMAGRMAHMMRQLRMQRKTWPTKNNSQSQWRRRRRLHRRQQSPLCGSGRPALLPPLLHGR